MPEDHVAEGYSDEVMYSFLAWGYPCTPASDLINSGEITDFIPKPRAIARIMGSVANRE
jgi:hypothetical protein